MMKIPFNKPYLTGKELDYVNDAVSRGHISGNGHFTKLCNSFFQSRLSSTKCLLTSSCTDALEMCALLLNIEPGDEIIVPSYTFVSTANAFVLRGAKIVFADSRPDHPGIDEYNIENLITPRTKAIVPVHYGGVACDMDRIMDLAAKHKLYVVEDAAQAIDSFYTSKDGKAKSLGSIGHLSAFSFHETKNIISGEGGMLAINDQQFEKRAEIIWEKGTNRSSFFKGEVDKYGWVDVGSSFLPSDMIAAFLYAQLESLGVIQEKRKLIWNTYASGLKSLEEQGKVGLPKIPHYSSNNSHLFYLLCKNLAERDELIRHLAENNIHAVFHYLSLHQSPFYQSKHDGRALPNSDRYSEQLVRLPLYYELTPVDQEKVINSILDFFNR